MSSATEKTAPAKQAKKIKKPATKSSRPPTSEMVKAAISSLGERTGSSLAAIKKYLAATYKVDPMKEGHFIRRALKTGVEKNALTQVKGSYKLAKVEAKKKPAKKSAAKPKAAKKKTNKPKAAKAKSTKKPKKAEKSKSAKKASKPKKPVAKKAAKPAKKPAKKAAPKKK